MISFDEINTRKKVLFISLDSDINAEQFNILSVKDDKMLFIFDTIVCVVVDEADDENYLSECLDLYDGDIDLRHQSTIWRDNRVFYIYTNKEYNPI